MDNKVKIIELVIQQALGIITKSSPFGQIPVVNSVINSIAEKSIRIALEKTFLSSYIDRVQEELDKESKTATDLRKVISEAKTPGEKYAAQEKLKESLKKLFTH